MNRAIETTKIIMELIELTKQLKEAEKRGEATGLPADELAFYDENESARQVMGYDILKHIATDPTSSIRNNLTIDWAIRDRVQRRWLPPDKTP